MKNKQNRIAVVVMSLVVLLMLALGPVASGVAAAPQGGVVDGLHGLWADPMAGGGSGT